MHPSKDYGSPVGEIGVSLYEKHDDHWVSASMNTESRIEIIYQIDLTGRDTDLDILSSWLSADPEIATWQVGYWGHLRRAAFEFAHEHQDVILPIVEGHIAELAGNLPGDERTVAEMEAGWNALPYGSTERALARGRLEIWRNGVAEDRLRLDRLRELARAIRLPPDPAPIGSAFTGWPETTVPTGIGPFTVQPMLDGTIEISAHDGLMSHGWRCRTFATAELRDGEWRLLRHWPLHVTGRSLNQDREEEIRLAVLQAASSFPTVAPGVWEDFTQTRARLEQRFRAETDDLIASLPAENFKLEARRDGGQWRDVKLDGIGYISVRPLSLWEYDVKAHANRATLASQGTPRVRLESFFTSVRVCPDGDLGVVHRSVTPYRRKKSVHVENDHPFVKLAASISMPAVDMYLKLYAKEANREMEPAEEDPVAVIRRKLGAGRKEPSAEPEEAPSVPTP